MQKNHSDGSRVTQHALVLGPSDHVLKSDLTEPALLAQPVNAALQSDPSQKSDKSNSPCMAPRATIKEQGFSETVAARIEAPQRGSTRSVRPNGPFLQSGASLIRWTSGHPPVKSACEACEGIMHSHKMTFSVVWQAGVRRPD